MQPLQKHCGADLPRAYTYSSRQGLEHGSTSVLEEDQRIPAVLLGLARNLTGHNSSPLQTSCSHWQCTFSSQPSLAHVLLHLQPIADVKSRAIPGLQLRGSAGIFWLGILGRGFGASWT